MIIKAAGRFEDARQLLAARAHVVNVCLGGFVAVVEAAFLAGLRPEDFVVAVGVEGRVEIFEVNTGVGQFLQLLQIVAAIDDARVDKRGRFRRCRCRFLGHAVQCSGGDQRRQERRGTGVA